ncbi:MAG: hypothetical protein WBQ25_23380 [Nitrososphaeraceae archaeon]
MDFSYGEIRSEILLEMIHISWEDMNEDEFIASAKGQNFIRVLWNDDFRKGTSFRKCILTNNLQWNYIMLNSFLPRYKYGLDWNDPLAENFKVQEYHLVMPAEVRSHLDTVMRNAKDFTVTTAYHKTLDKRLVIDGVHRALGIESKSISNDLFPAVTIIECYSNKIDENFEFDFRHLKRTYGMIL